MKNTIVTIEGNRGEYTGFSRIQGKITHYFSMYDGSVIKLSELPKGITAYEAPASLSGFNYPQSLLK